MLKQTQIQNELKKTFPEFYNKSQLINYYCSFDFPEKQMKMVSWWLKVVEFIIEHQNRVYITYQELITYLTIYNLKPTPVPAILNYLAQQQKLGPANQYQVRQELKESQQEEKSFFGSVMSYFSKPATKQFNIFKCEGNEKIFSRKIKEFKKQQIKKELHHIFTQHSKSMNQIKLVEQLEKKVILDRQSVFELLRELDGEQVIKMLQHGQRTFVLYSHNSSDLHNKEWCEVERMKFCLRQQIDKFEYMVGRQQDKIMKLKERAKEHLANGNKKSSMTLCKEAVDIEKKITNIATRKKLLDNQITQLQYNEMNKSAIALLEEAHQIYEQTQIDPSKLDQIAQKNQQIEFNNKHTNDKLENMLGQEEYEEDVDQMMKELQKETIRRPEKIGVHVDPQKMDIESIDGKKVRKEEKMDIESIDGRKVEENYN